MVRVFLCLKYGHFTAHINYPNRGAVVVVWWWFCHLALDLTYLIICATLYTLGDFTQGMLKKTCYLTQKLKGY